MPRPLLPATSLTNSELQWEAEKVMIQEAFASAIGSLRLSFPSITSHISELVKTPEHDHHRQHDRILEENFLPRPLIPPPIIGKAYALGQDQSTSHQYRVSRSIKVPAKSGNAKVQRRQPSKAMFMTAAEESKLERRKGRSGGIDEMCITLEMSGARCLISSSETSHASRAKEVLGRRGKWAMEGLSVFDDSGNEADDRAAAMIDRVVARLRREAKASYVEGVSAEDMVKEVGGDGVLASHTADGFR